MQHLILCQLGIRAYEKEGRVPFTIEKLVHDVAAPPPHCWGKEAEEGCVRHYSLTN